MSKSISTKTDAQAAQQNDKAVFPRMPRILVAEDDKEMRRLLVWNLHKAGFDVIECSDGWELLDHLGNPVLDGEPDDYDLIVSDIRMPGVTGLEVLEGIHETEWFVPMILITAFGSAEVHREAEEFGAADVFDKPFEIESLIKRIREVLVLDAPSGHNWQPGKMAPAVADTVPIDVIFEHMEPLEHIKTEIAKSAMILRDLNDKILYSRAVITGPGNGDLGRYHIQIMVTLMDKVFVVRSNLKSIRSVSELSDAIPTAFEVTLGKIRKHLGNIQN